MGHLALGALLLGLLSSCWARDLTAAKEGSERRVLTLPIRSAGPGSMDPVRGSTTYDNQACSFVYETLLQYKYLKRPLELEPLLCVAMPEVSEDRLVYTFRLREDVYFHDDPCFEGGTGRQLTAEDVVYSWKRLADQGIGTKNWWLLENTIRGLDEWSAVQNAAESFDYDVPCEGLLATDRFTLRVELTEPVHRFLYVLAMFQTSVVPREAVEFYGETFPRHPVGTGPFTMREEDWKTSKSLDFERNTKFREELYPEEWMPEDEERGLHLDAGKRLPLADHVRVNCYVQDQPMWLEFRTGLLDYAQIPAENYVDCIRKRTRSLKKQYRDEGITYHPVPLLDFIFRGFNMEDPLLGGYDERSKKVRQAISLATDLKEFNNTFYNGQNIVYDGMIPPGLDGHPEGGRCEASYTGPDIDRARALLAEAGYPDGEGLPRIDYYTSLAANSQEQTELFQRQLGAIGIELNAILLEFPQLIEAINKRKAPIFSFAWGSDYPDGENNLALFYGPYESPGSNHYNYRNERYDELYERIRSMPPSPERTKLYEEMRDIVLEDVPFIGGMARTRNYLASPRIRNFKPTEDFWNWFKYLDVGERELED
jgi:ABC-type transport system substrate-binding protein